MNGGEAHSTPWTPPCVAVVGVCGMWHSVHRAWRSPFLFVSKSLMSSLLSVNSERSTCPTNSRPSLRVLDCLAGCFLSLDLSFLVSQVGTVTVVS